MKKDLKKSILSIICFCFFMILAGGSGCNGCSSGGYYNTNNEVDSLGAADAETPLKIDESKEVYSTDVAEDEREEEETYQSESDDDLSNIEEDHEEDAMEEKSDSTQARETSETED